MFKPLFLHVSATFSTSVSAKAFDVLHIDAKAELLLQGFQSVESWRRCSGHRDRMVVR